MRLVVTGGRKGARRELVDARLGAVHRKHGITLLIEGGATGYDRECREWAKRNSVPFITENADWDDIDAPGAVVRVRRDGTKYNALAGHWRNQRMIDKHKPGAGVAFPGGTGTADMTARIKAAHIPVWEVRG